MELHLTGSSSRLLATCRPASLTGSIQTHIYNRILRFNMPNNKYSKNEFVDGNVEGEQDHRLQQGKAQGNSNVTRPLGVQFSLLL